MKLDDLVFHVGRETLSKTGLCSHGDGVTTLPVGIPAKGRFKLGVGAELLVSPFSNHGFGNAVFTGNFTIVVDCLGFCNDFQLEVEVIRVTARAWHINDRTKS